LQRSKNDHVFEKLNMARTPNIVHKRPPIVGGDSNYQPLTIFSNEQTIDEYRKDLDEWQRKDAANKSEITRLTSELERLKENEAFRSELTQVRQENQRLLEFKLQAERDLDETTQALNQSKRITKELAAYHKAKMHLSILLSLIALFILSSFGMHANEDSQLHGRKATSKNQRTQFKIVERQEPLARMLTIDSENEQIDEAKQAWAQETLLLSLAEVKELKRMSDKKLARAIEKKASNSIHSSLQLRLAGSVDSPRNVKLSKQKQENLDSETSNPTIDQHREGVEHSQAITSDTSETSNPLTDQDREGEEHSQAVPDVKSQHVKTRVNN
jgi:hypothetical protein